MTYRQKYKRSVSAFVLAFLCLNVGGVACLAYCNQAGGAKASQPMAAMSTMPAGHCSHHNQGVPAAPEATHAQAGSTTCCSMPVSFFAAPLERRLDQTFETVATVPAVIVEFARPVINKPERAFATVYRPPPRDRRTDRLLNCVIRI